MTDHRSGDARPLGRRRFQFSLRGLMVFALGVALASSAIASEGTNWSYGPLALVVICIILGLLNQVRDLWTTFHGRPDLSSDERWGWRFAVFWRVAVVCLWVGQYITAGLAARGILLLPEREGGFADTGSNLRHGLLCLSLLIVLASVPTATQPRHRPLQSRVLRAASLIVGVVWCFVIWTLMTSHAHLVNVALQGMEASWPRRFAIQGLDPDMTARSRAFLWRSVWGIVFVPINLVLVHQLSQRWGRGLRVRLILTGLLALSLAMTAWYPIWVYSTGLHKTSPMMAEAMVMGPAHLWMSAVLLVIVFVTAATYRMVQPQSGSVGAEEPNWRRRPRSYHHERPGVIILLVAGTTLVDFVSDWLFWSQWFHWFHSPPLLAFAWSFIESFLFVPARYMSLAVILLGLHRAWIGWSRSTDSSRAGPPTLPLWRFCAVWLAMFLTTVTGIPTIAWFSFAFWMGPW